MARRKPLADEQCKITGRPARVFLCKVHRGRYHVDKHRKLLLTLFAPEHTLADSICRQGATHLGLDYAPSGVHPVQFGKDVIILYAVSSPDPTDRFVRLPLGNFAVRLLARAKAVRWVAAGIVGLGVVAAGMWAINRKSAKDPPGPLLLPLIGSAHTLLPNMHAGMARLRNSFGPVVMVNIVGRTMYVITDYKLAAPLLRLPDKRLPTSLAGIKLPEVARQGLFLCDGDTWQRQRHAIDNAFSANQSTYLSQALELLVPFITGLNSKHLDLQLSLRMLLSDFASQLVYGAKPEAMQNLSPSALTALAVSVESEALRIQTSASAFSPLARAALANNAAELLEKIKTIQPTAASLYALMTKNLADIEKRDVFMTLLAPGSTMMVKPLMTAFEHLSKSSGIMGRVRAEVDAVFEAQGITQVTQLQGPIEVDLKGMLPKLEYTRKVAIEAVRFRSTPAATRGLGQDTACGDFTLVKDGIVYVPLGLMEPDDDRFDPDRDWRTHPSLPFGGGPRVCPAQGLSIPFMTAVIAAVVRFRDITVSRAGSHYDFADRFAPKHAERVRPQPKAVRHAPLATIAVFYNSNSGRTRVDAEQVARAFGVVATEITSDWEGPSKDPSVCNVIMFPTYGGDPTITMQQHMNKVDFWPSKTHYVIVGTGSKAYGQTYLAASRRLYEQLSAIQPEALYHFENNVELEVSVIPQVIQDLGTMTGKAARAQWTAERIRTSPAPVTTLTVADNTMDNGLAIITFESTDLTDWEPGDHLSILPPNTDSSIDAFTSSIGDSSTFPGLDTVLKWSVDLKNAPVTVDGTVEQRLETLRPQVWRQYSIASKRGSKLRIGVSDAKGGLCSEYLRALQKGASVVGQVVPSRPMRMPSDVPVYCISTGSGITPFIGFVEQRTPDRRESQIEKINPVMAALAANVSQIDVPAPSIHFYHGGRGAEYPFQAMLAAAQAAEVITLHYANSQTEPKLYVQQVLEQNKVAIQADFEKGCKFYVCGQKRMHDAVKKTIGDIVGPNKLEGRYYAEVFG